MYLPGMITPLQRELKQTRPFARPETEALVSVMRTAAVIEHAVGEALRPFGVTMTQYNVLRILRGAGEAGLCGRDVGERLVSKVPDVPRLLDRMSEMGLIRRERDERDRRHVTARLSPEGAGVLEAADPVIEALERRHFATLGEAGMRSLVDALALVRKTG
jgi:DNA-binding MarR family transcriptional regulator